MSAFPNQARSPFHDAAEQLQAAGWSPFPLPYGQKAPPPINRTGAHGAWTTPDELFADLGNTPLPANVGVRLLPGVLGLDVDAYAKGGQLKPGAATLAGLERDLGALPTTWRLTSRDDGVSGIRFYGVREDSAWDGDAGPGIEVISWHYRYAVAPPSLHPDTGRFYRWVDPDGNPSLTPPDTADLPDLPMEWHEALRTGPANSAGTVDRTQLADGATVQRFVDVTIGPPCPVMERAVAEHQAALAAGGSRHAATLAALWSVTSLATEGHTGGSTALQAVQVGFMGAVADDPRRPAQHEWRAMLLGAVTRADSRVWATSDPCRVINDLTGMTDEQLAAREKPANPDASVPLLPVPSVGDQPEAASQADSSGTTALVGERTSRVPPWRRPDLLDKLREQVPPEYPLEETVRRQWFNETVREFVREQRAAAPPTLELDLAAPMTLADELELEPEPMNWTVPGWLAEDSTTILVADRKAGKTTLLCNLAVALVDGRRFLGHETFAQGAVGICHWEMTATQARQWLVDLEPEHPELLTQLYLRGHTWALTNLETQDRTIKWLIVNKVTTWILDTYTAAARQCGDNENDANQAGKFLDAVSLIARAAGVRRVILSAHVTRGGQPGEFRSMRGSGVPEGWADQVWQLKADENGVRQLRVIGRDVTDDVLTLHSSDGRHVTVESHPDAAIDMLGDVLVAQLLETPALTEIQLYRACQRTRTAQGDGQLAFALKTAIGQGRIALMGSDSGTPGALFARRDGEIVAGIDVHA